MSVSERIKEIRKDNNLTQKDFGSELTVTASYISRIESGTESPTEMLLNLMALKFDVSYEWLKNGTGNKANNTPPYTKEMYEILDDAKLTSLFLDTNYAEKRTYAFCLSVLVSIFKTAGVQKNSKRYFTDQIKNILISLDKYFHYRSYVQNNYGGLNDDDVLKKQMHKELLALIEHSISEASEALTTEELDCKLENA